MSSEKTLEANLSRRVKVMGGWSLKLWPVSATGLPDRIVLLPGGRIRFVELKSTGKKPTPRQAIVHQQLRDIGFDVAVISTQHQLTEFLNNINL